MHKSRLDIAGRRRSHHEAPVGRLIQTHACEGIVHVRDNLLGIEQNNKMLGEEAQTVHDQVFLRKPDRATLGYAETPANNADIYVR